VLAWPASLGDQFAAIRMRASLVGALLRLLPSATELPGCPEAPRPEFTPHLESFPASVAGFAGSPG
jgi:hypothetical protein